MCPCLRPCPGRDQRLPRRPHRPRQPRPLAYQSPESCPLPPESPNLPNRRLQRTAPPPRARLAHDSFPSPPSSCPEAHAGDPPAPRAPADPSSPLPLAAALPHPLRPAAPSTSSPRSPPDPSFPCVLCFDYDNNNNNNNNALCPALSGRCSRRRGRKETHLRGGSARSRTAGRERRPRLPGAQRLENEIKSKYQALLSLCRRAEYGGRI